MGHVDAAVTEMFRAVHMQLLGNTCRLEKLLLAALVMETRATGAHPWQAAQQGSVDPCLWPKEGRPEG